MLHLPKRAEVFWMFIFFATFSLLCEAIVQGPTDYCLLQRFEPTCNQDEIILINKAVFGRMEYGKCIQPGTGRAGCYADVVKIMDYLCSGKPSCSVRAVNEDLTATNPCNSETMPSYLRVSYSCIKVTKLDSTCSKPLRLKHTKGFIKSDSATNGCPILLTPEAGSRINLTLYNFLKPKERSACYEVAKIKDGITAKTIHICENNERTKLVHLSSSSTLEITFTQGQKIGNFLISYEALGCSSPPVPDNAHAIREGDTATIVCNNSDTTWTTTCKDNKWTKQDRECPESWSFTGIVKSSKDFPYGIFLTSIIGVSIGVLIGGFLLFLAINAFQRHQRREQYNPPPVIPDPDYKIYDTARMDLSFVPGLGHSTLPRHQMAAADVPPAPPPLSEETMKRLSRHTYERPNFLT